MDAKTIIEIKKCKLAISKANAAKEQIELDILEREMDIVRMKEHAVLQEKEIEKAQTRLAEFGV